MTLATSHHVQAVRPDGEPPRRAERIPAALMPHRAVFLAATALALLGLMGAARSPRMIFFASSGLILAAATAPFALRRRGSVPLSGWDAVVAAAIVGVGVRSIYFFLERPDGDTLDFFFFRGSEPDDLTDAALLYAAAFGLAAIGFTAALARRDRRPLRRRIEVTAISTARVRVFCRILGAGSIGVIAIFGFVLGEGLNFENFSAQRGIRLDRTDSNGAETLVRAFSFLATPALLLHLGAKRNDGRRFGHLSWNVALALLALLPAIYSSTRQNLFIPFALLLIAMRLRGVRIRLVPALLVVVLVSTAFTLTTITRSTRQDSISADALSPTTAIDSMVVNRNFIDYTRLHNLRRAQADGVGLVGGVTYLAPLYAPIPRAIWEGKPQVAPGERFAADAYGNADTGGVPPDGFTELAWNFGIPIMLVGAMPFGFVLGRLDGYFLRVFSGPFAYFGYVAAPALFPFRSVNIGVAQAVSLTLQTVLVAGFVCVVCGVRFRFQTVHDRGKALTTETRRR